MFLEDPGYSPYDVSFRLLDTPVRIHYSFWIGAVVLGWNLGRDPELGFGYLAVWTGLLFLSVLVHEFGHVLMSRLFGRPGHIILYAMGGLAISHTGRTRWQQIAVSLAGPGAGFVLLAVAIVVIGLISGNFEQFTNIFVLSGMATPHGLREFHPWVGESARNLLWLNFFLGLFNLLPVWPLDGGMVCRELCQLAVPGNGLRISLIISAVVAGALSANAVIGAARGKALIPYLPTDMFIALFMGLLAFGSIQLLQTTPRRGGSRGRNWDDDDARDRVPWERDADWWKR